MSKKKTTKRSAKKRSGMYRERLGFRTTSTQASAVRDFARMVGTSFAEVLREAVQNDIAEMASQTAMLAALQQLPTRGQPMRRVNQPKQKKKRAPRRKDGRFAPQLGLL